MSPARIQFRFNIDFKNFTDEQKLRVQHHHPRFTMNAKGTSFGRKHKKRKKPTKANPKQLRKR